MLKIQEAQTVLETSERIWRSAQWLQALDLEERRRLSQPVDRSLLDLEKATHRLEKWRQQKPFAERPDLWQKRLELLASNDDEHLALLGESPAQLRKRFEASSAPDSSISLDWLQEIEQAYSDSTEPFEWLDTVDPQQVFFLPLIEPLIQRAYERLCTQAEACLTEHPAAPFEARSAARCFTTHLPVLLAPMLSRAMVVELHVARLEERLQGETSEERFAEFVRGLRDSAQAVEILERYPVLARQLVERIAGWQVASGEVLERLATDGEELSRRFGDGQLGRLSEVRGAAGDPHRGGRTVHILTFDSGQRVVYKPRPMAVEKAFQHFLGWVNRQGGEHPFKLLEIWDVGPYGWVEYVNPAPCETAEEVERFYYRMGGYLAILHLLDGTDFHHENLIAVGEHPVLIDLETLFQPWVIGDSLHEIDEISGAVLRSTVLRSNLLPEHWWGSREEAGVDLSGMGSKSGQLTPRPVVATTDRGTDEMRVERRRVEIPEGENRPRLGDQDVSLLDHSEDLRRGWRDHITLLGQHRDALLSESGPLSVFRGTEVRVLFRTTAAYGALLYESYHPHLVGSHFERQRLFDGLWSDVALRPWLAELISVELKDLADGDVPLFITRPDSTDVWTASGERFPDMLGETGFEGVERRLRDWDSNRKRQEAIIDDTFGIIRVSSSDVRRPAFDFESADELAGREALLAAACRAGDRVVERAFVSSTEAFWLEVTFREPNGWQLVPTGPDIYLGNPGIALALGYLGEIAGREDFTHIARKAVQSMIHQIDASPQFLEGIGGFSGWGGAVYTLTHLGTLWQEEALLDKATDYTQGLSALAAEDDLLDVVAGSAGCILGLLGLYEASSGEAKTHLHDVLLACGDRLLEKAEPQERGMGWVMPMAGPRPLAGFSHGAAGIALALLRVAALSGDDRYQRTALEAIEFERGLFQPAERNWPDLRAGAEAAGLDSFQGHQMWAWCHGAPGVGMARLYGLPWLDDAQVRSEIEHATASTLEHGFGKNHSLCHGDLGNLDFLLDVARESADPAAWDEVYRRAGGLLTSIEKDGWLFGLAGNLETPSLMVGLAGIAYGLARLAEPDRLPSILALSPPLES